MIIDFISSDPFSLRLAGGVMVYWSVDLHMNLAHVHLLLNHFPSIGTIIGLGLLILALIARSEDLKRSSLVVLFAIALITIPTYMSGNAAQEAVCLVPPTPAGAPCPNPVFSRPIIEAHRDAAMLGYIFIELAGIFSWLGLWQYRRTGRVALWTLCGVLIFAAMTIPLMANASTIGGVIRHPEILDNPAAVAAASKGVIGINVSQIGLMVRDEPWMWPTCETLHFVGLSLLVGVVLLVDLRMLGVVKQVSFATLHRLLPWGILGFALNLATGMAFFVAAPEQYTTNKSFQFKMLFVLIAGANALYFTSFDEAWEMQPGDDAPMTARVAATSAVILWIAVMFCGSMLPFLGNAF